MGSIVEVYIHRRERIKQLEELIRKVISGATKGQQG